MFQVDDRARLDDTVFHFGEQVLPARQNAGMVVVFVRRVQQGDRLPDTRWIVQIESVHAHSSKFLTAVFGAAAFRSLQAAASGVQVQENRSFTGKRH